MTPETKLVARLERLAAKYEANHLNDHARGVRHAIREVQATFVVAGQPTEQPEQK